MTFHLFYAKYVIQLYILNCTFLTSITASCPLFIHARKHTPRSNILLIMSSSDRQSVIWTRHQTYNTDMPSKCFSRKPWFWPMIANILLLVSSNVLVSLFHVVTLSADHSKVNTIYSLCTSNNMLFNSHNDRERENWIPTDKNYIELTPYGTIYKLCEFPKYNINIIIDLTKG